MPRSIAPPPRSSAPAFAFLSASPTAAFACAACTAIAVALASLSALAATPAPAKSPLRCGAPVGAVETTLCGSDTLKALDARLAEAMTAAGKKGGGHPDRLAAEQKTFHQRRAACEKAKDVAACLDENYKQQIASIQARYALVKMRGPFTFMCDGPRPGKLLVRYFETDPSSALFDHDGKQAMGFIALSGSGAKYDGPSVHYWEAQGQATVNWFGATIVCKPLPGTP